MIKTIKFGEKEVKFSTAFMWAFKYKAQFKRDPANAILPVFKEQTEESTDEDMGMALLECLGFIGLVQIAWSMAALCDKDIPEPEAWVESLGDDFEVMELLSEIIPEAIDSLFATKKYQPPTPPKSGAKKQK